MQEEVFSKYKDKIGWKPMSEYSDPLGTYLPKDRSKITKTQIEAAIAQADMVTGQVIGYWRNISPAITPQALEELLFAGASLPNVYNLNKKGRGAGNRAEANKTLQFGTEKGGGGGVAGVDQGNGSGHFPGQLPGEQDSTYASRVNAPPSGTGENFGAPAPVRFPGS